MGHREGFNIIGEAARQVSEATKAAYLAIDWRRIVGLPRLVEELKRIMR